MRILSAGDVVIGATSQIGSARFGVQRSGAGECIRWTDGATGGAITTVGSFGTNLNSDAFSFTTASTERMRITSAGAVYIGDTTGSTRFYVTNDNRVAMFNATNTTVGTEVIVQSNLISSNNATSADYLFIGGISGGSDRVYILGNGNLQNINNSYGTLSDIKLKENIVDATSKLDDVMQLKVRNFNLKSDPTQKQIGFVAQELETVFPSMIEEVSELDEDKKFTGNKVKGIKTTVLIPILVKAIQEQQAIINELKARIETLENT
jgi:hypothetical protein